MSLEATVALLDPTARRSALRLAFGMMLGFLLAAMFRLEFFFLPPLLAVQILALTRRPPSLAEAGGIFLLIALLAIVTPVVSSAVVRQPLIYVSLIGLVLFFGFLLDSAGKRMPATFILMLGATIPLVLVQSTQAASILSRELIAATAIALLVVWAVFAAFPATTTASTAAIAQPAAAHAAPRAALINLLLLLPVLLLFLFDTALSLVAVIVIINIVRQRERGMASRAALGLLFGNVLGGALATLAYFFVSVRPGTLFFLLVVLLVGLVLGGRGAIGAAKAPVYSVALGSFVILLGLGVVPLPSDSGVLFVERLFNVLLAGAYAVGAIALASVPHADSR
jgi:hypothetical protein